MSATTEKKTAQPREAAKQAEPKKKPAAKQAESKPKTAKAAESKQKSVEKPKAVPKSKTAEKAKSEKPKAPAKRSAKKAETIGESSKTPQVMRLVEQRSDMVNPTILAGKSSIPRKLRGLEPLTKIMKRDAETMFGIDEEAETFNLTALVIDDHAAAILRRFNACDCEMCIERLSQLTADSVPARFVKLKRRSVERKSAEVEELKAPLKRMVTSRMIRLVVQNKKRSFHDI